MTCILEINGYFICERSCVCHLNFLWLSYTWWLTILGPNSSILDHFNLCALLMRTDPCRRRLSYYVRYIQETYILGAQSTRWKTLYNVQRKRSFIQAIMDTYLQVQSIQEEDWLNGWVEQGRWILEVGWVGWYEMEWMRWDETRWDDKMWWAIRRSQIWSIQSRTIFIYSIEFVERREGIQRLLLLLLLLFETDFFGPREMRISMSMPMMCQSTVAVLHCSILNFGRDGDKTMWWVR